MYVGEQVICGGGYWCFPYHGEAAARCYDRKCAGKPGNALPAIYGRPGCAQVRGSKGKSVLSFLARRETDSSIRQQRVVCPAAAVLTAFVRSDERRDDGVVDRL